MTYFFLADLGITLPSQTVLFYDSRSSLAIAKNLVFHERTKHIDMDCHFVHECIKARVLKALYVSTHDQQTNFFTKLLAPKTFTMFNSKLGIHSIYDLAYEGC